MTTPHQRVLRILDKLAQVRARGLTCFGSDRHRFQLNRPATEGEIQSFEEEHGIRLPDAYRTFLLFAGTGGSTHGGAGPYYGLYSLQEWNDLADWVLDDIPSDFLARECPLHPDITPEEWEHEFDVTLAYQGTLSLGTMGCTGMIQLIVTGPFAGRVVYADADGQKPYVVHDLDFLSWYERWLDELLGGYSTSWFGYGPGGSESDLLRILNDPGASDRLKSEAASALCRLPELSSTASTEIPNYLFDPVAGVRAGACAVIRQFKLLPHCNAAARLLSDLDPTVRQEAARTVMELDPGGWAQAVLQRLRIEPTAQVATTAFFALEKAGALPKSELVGFIERSPIGNLRYLAAHTASYDEGDLPLLIHMLNDRHPEVRCCATLGLRHLQAREKLPEAIDLLTRETDHGVISSTLNMLKELGDESVVATLLKWTRSSDDFHRLEALEAIATLGVDQAGPVAEAMLLESRSPVRRSADGIMGSAHCICDLVRSYLRNSPSPALRKLVQPN